MWQEVVTTHVASSVSESPDGDGSSSLNFHPSKRLFNGRLVCENILAAVKTIVISVLKCTIHKSAQEISKSKEGQEMKAPSWAQNKVLNVDADKGGLWCAELAPLCPTLF